MEGLPPARWGAWPARSFRRKALSLGRAPCALGQESLLHPFQHLLRVLLTLAKGARGHGPLASGEPSPSEQTVVSFLSSRRVPCALDKVHNSANPNSEPSHVSAPHKWLLGSPLPCPHPRDPACSARNLGHPGKTGLSAASSGECPCVPGDSQPRYAGGRQPPRHPQQVWRGRGRLAS